MGIRARASPHKYKKARHAIGNVSMKDPSKSIREFEKFPYKSYERRRLKQDPPESYLYLSRQLAKCMMSSQVRKISHLVSSHLRT